MTISINFFFRMRSFKKLLYGRIGFLKLVAAVLVCLYTCHLVRYYATWYFTNPVSILRNDNLERSPNKLVKILTRSREVDILIDPESLKCL